MAQCTCPLPHELMETRLPETAIGRLLFEVVKALLVHDENFTAGNPALFKMPTDVKGVEVVAVLHLQGIGRPININNRASGIWTPESRN